MHAKIRIIPTILTDGINVVKGSNFKNWRTVGNAQATARLYAARDVDEIMLIDVNARKNNKCISREMIEYFANVLQVPFSVGGGISNIEQATSCMRGGAEKILLGTSAFETPNLISQVAHKFGSQAVIVSVDVTNSENLNISTNSGLVPQQFSALDFAVQSQELGAGEILLQNIEKDGTLEGPTSNSLEQLVQKVNVPIIVSGGISNANQIFDLYKAGASAVAIGALFQFTEKTPQSIASELVKLGLQVRNK